MDGRDIQRRLTTQSYGRILTLRDEITSTRDLARERLVAGALRPGEVILADRQTAGRGTPGKTFVSGTPEGVWMTLALAGPPGHGVTLRAGAALVDVLRADFGLAAHLKWPNDVLIGRLKVAGLIAEGMSGPSRAPWCMLSAGVNVGQASFAGTPVEGIACSLRMAGAPATREEVLAALLNRLEPALASGEELPPMFGARSLMIGRRVRVTESGSEREVVVDGVDETGALLVRGDSGPERWVSSAVRDISSGYGSADPDSNPGPCRS